MEEKLKMKCIYCTKEIVLKDYYRATEMPHLNTDQAVLKVLVDCPFCGIVMGVYIYLKMTHNIDGFDEGINNDEKTK